MPPQALLADLRRLLGPDGLLEDPALRLGYEADGLRILRQMPDLVLLPQDTDQAQACMQYLAKRGIPVVPRGAGTGLSGGATPVPGGVCIATTRITPHPRHRPRSPHRTRAGGGHQRRAFAASGALGLFYAPDPSSQAACTLGGNFAENSGGPHGFKYGQTSRHVRGALLINARGERWDLLEPAVDPDGPDLLGLCIGSEGMLGLVTELTLDLLPLPECSETLLAIFPSLAAACRSVTALIAAGADPSAIEILDALTIQAVEASVFAAGYPRDAEARRVDGYGRRARGGAGSA
ncbi:MAG: FAD-binding protein [Planctomycetota bacterium]